jgi:glycosyltransferase involved in cell wall biosynthesis
VRIALVVPGGVDRSGEYRVIPTLLALIRRLAASHDLHVFALSQDATPGQWQLEGAQVHNIGALHTVVRAVRTIFALHRERPFDLLHSIWSGTPGLVAITAGRICRVPSLVHVAGGELVALRDINYGGRLSWRGRLREALILRSTSCITAASQPVIQSLADLGLRAERVPLGVDLEKWQPRAPVRRATGAIARLIHLASLNLVKDQTTLMHALSLLRQSGETFQMDIVGEDTLGGAVQGLAASLGLSSQVRFRGFLTQAALRPLVEAADLMVLSSRHEAGPLALLEAAVAGVPTVGTAVGHVAEWAPDASVAVPVADAAALAEAARRLLGDEDLRLQIAKAAHERAVAENADYTARQFESLYERLTGARRDAK